MLPNLGRLWASSIEHSALWGAVRWSMAQSQEQCPKYETETGAEATSTCVLGQATSHIASTSIERTTSNKISVCQCEQANPGQIQGGGEASSSGHERQSPSKRPHTKSCCVFRWRNKGSDCMSMDNRWASHGRRISCGWHCGTI